MGIEIYLTVAFWLGFIAIIRRGGNLVTREYPHKEQTTIGQEVFCLLLVIFFFVWVCYLKFVAGIAGAM